MAGSGDSDVKKLKLFTDPFSPCCRSVELLLEMESIPYEKRTVELRKVEQLTDLPVAQELAKANPARLIPTLDDDGFCLFESIAIVKYICMKYNLPDHWYPSDLRKRALVEQYLHWHPGNIRCNAFYLKCVEKLKTGQVNERRLAEQEKVLKKSLNFIDSHFLKNNKYIIGEEISIADLMCLCQITQYWISDFAIEDHAPNVKRWIEDCKQALNPHFDAVHEVVYDCRKAGTFKATYNI